MNVKPGNHVESDTTIATEPHTQALFLVLHSGSKGSEALNHPELM